MTIFRGKPNELATILFNLDKEKTYEIKEYKPLRSLSANRYFHSLINELGKYNRSHDVVISDDELKVKINLQYGSVARDGEGNVIGAKVPQYADMGSFYPYSKRYKTEDNLDCYVFYKRTSELDTKEFSQLIKGLEAECKDVGIEILSDKEFKEMMEEYERSWSKQQ